MSEPNLQLDVVNMENGILNFKKDASLVIKSKINTMDFRTVIRTINWFLIFSSVIIFNIPLFMNANEQAKGHPTGNYAYLSALLPNATEFDNALIRTKALTKSEQTPSELSDVFEIKNFFRNLEKKFEENETT